MPAIDGDAPAGAGEPGQPATPRRPRHRGASARSAACRPVGRHRQRPAGREALLASNDVGDADAEVLVDDHHFALGDRPAVDQDVDLLAGQLVELDDRAGGQGQDVADRQRRAADLDRDLEGHAEQEVDVVAGRRRTAPAVSSGSWAGRTLAGSCAGAGRRCRGRCRPERRAGAGAAGGRRACLEFLGRWATGGRRRGRSVAASAESAWRATMWAESSPATAVVVGRDQDEFLVVDRGDRQPQEEHRGVRRRRSRLAGAQAEPLAEDRLEGHVHAFEDELLEPRRRCRPCRRSCRPWPGRERPRRRAGRCRAARTSATAAAASARRRSCTWPTVSSPIVTGQSASAEIASAMAERSIGHSGRIEAPAPRDCPSAGFQSNVSQLMSGLHGLKWAHQAQGDAIPDSTGDRPRLGLIGDRDEDRLVEVLVEPDDVARAAAR